MPIPEVSLKNIVIGGALILTAYSLAPALPQSVHEIGLKIITSSPVVGGAAGMLIGGVGTLTYATLIIESGGNVASAGTALYYLKASIAIGGVIGMVLLTAVRHIQIEIT